MARIMRAVNYTVHVSELHGIWGTKKSLHTHWRPNQGLVYVPAILNMMALQAAKCGQVIVNVIMASPRK